MSGFSPQWLALREPADLAARNRQVLTACQRSLSRRGDLVICDMGAGTGASVRAFAGLLPRRQRWQLIDHDAQNLAAAKEALGVWADDTASSGDDVVLRRADRHLEIHTVVHDFARQPACWPTGTDLVTASALLDLTATAWIDIFVEALAEHRLPLLATLTVDGTMIAAPAHPLDEPVFTAFRRHQSRDKGFGPAAGANAASHLERALRKSGYEIESGDSPWIIKRSSPSLLHTMLSGIAAAVLETGDMTSADVERWLRHAVVNIRTLTIGHCDVFAWPSQSPAA